MSRLVSVRPGGLHDPDPLPAAGLAQHGVQPALPGDGGRLPGAEHHHRSGAQHPLQHRGRPHHPRHRDPRGGGEDRGRHQGGGHQDQVSVHKSVRRSDTRKRETINQEYQN